MYEVTKQMWEAFNASFEGEDAKKIKGININRNVEKAVGTNIL